MSRRKRLRKEKAQKVKEPKGVSEESKKRTRGEGRLP